MDNFECVDPSVGIASKSDLWNRAWRVTRETEHAKQRINSERVITLCHFFFNSAGHKRRENGVEKELLGIKSRAGIYARRLLNEYRLVRIFKPDRCLVWVTISKTATSVLCSSSRCECVPCILRCVPARGKLGESYVTHNIDNQKRVTRLNIKRRNAGSRARRRFDFAGLARATIIMVTVTMQQ